MPALLLISRYRDELRASASQHDAMHRALRRTTEAVVGSALTVFLAVLSLTPATRGIGLACAVGIVIAAAFALIVLPAALLLFGRWVFWPVVPHHCDQAAADRTTIFSRVGGVVSRRPVWVVTATVLLLAVLASGLSGLRIGLDEADQLLDRPESVTAAERLGESFPAGTADPTQVLSSNP